MLIASGLLSGFLFGYVLQHGRFCMNTAFREVLLSRDFTVFRAYILALVVSIIGANLLDDMGIIHLKDYPFTWVANILGGYLFGIAMVIGGGCASGTLYRVGEGLIGSWMAALGFILTATATLSGFLRPVAEFFWFGPGYNPDDPATAKFMYMMGDTHVTVYNILGLNRWIVIACIAVPALFFVSKGKFKKPATQKGFIWWTTGIMIGLISVFALYSSEIWGGMKTARGISFSGPYNELLTWFANSGTTADYKAAADAAAKAATAAGNADLADSISLQGGLAKAGTVTWSMWMLAGVVIGSLTSALKTKEFGWRSPKAQTLATQFGGGLLMGFAGTLAGGCNVGHGLTGLTTLALSSVVSLIFIILGCWTMVYFLFIKE